jgi:hypothetical protein
MRYAQHDLLLAGLFAYLLINNADLHITNAAVAVKAAG